MIVLQKQLTSRQRVEKTFNHEKVDRVPKNYMANKGIHDRLCKYLNIKTDLDAVHEALEIDFKEVTLEYTGKKLFSERENRKIDPLWGSVMRWVTNESGGYWDYCDFPLKDLDTINIEDWPLPNPDDFDYETAIEYCKKHKDKALHYGNPGLGDVMNSLGMIRSVEEMYMDMLLETPEIIEYLDKRNNIQVEILERVLSCCGKYLSFVWTGEDLGTQHTPLISMDVFNKQIYPRHKKIVDLATSYNLPVMVHCCGSSSWAFERFIEMGIKAVDTLQPEAFNMEPEYLVKNFGDKLAFHGCISTAKLATMTKTEITLEVKKILEIMKPTNAYCLSPTHLIQDNTPVENILAMYDAAV